MGIDGGLNEERSNQDGRTDERQSRNKPADSATEEGAIVELASTNLMPNRASDNEARYSKEYVYSEIPARN